MWFSLINCSNFPNKSNQLYEQYALKLVANEKPEIELHMKIWLEIFENI